MRSSPNANGYVTDANGNCQIPLRGRGFLIRAGGSSPGAYGFMARTLGGQGQAVPIIGPDCFFFGDDEFNVIVIEGASPNATYFVYAFNAQGEGIISGGTPGSSSIIEKAYTALYNSALNTPAALITAGVSLAGATGWYGVIAAPAGQTILTGTARFYRFDPAAAIADWILNPALNVDLAQFAGQRRAVTVDYDTFVGWGGVFCEVLNGTHSGGAGAFDVYLRAGRAS